MKSLAPTSKQGWLAKGDLVKRRFLRSILIINDTPHRVAFGIAIGTFVAYQPIVGVQMILGVFLALAFRANVTATLPPAWITNPLTIVPIYMGLHWLGNLFVGGPGLRWSQLREALQQINTVRSEQGLWSSLVFGFNEFMTTIIYPMAIGGAIVGVLNALLFYYLTYKAISAYQHRKMLKRLEWIKHCKPRELSHVNHVAGSEFPQS